MKALHTIKMVNTKEEGVEAVYANVVSADWKSGCTVELQLADGNTATFETSEWELWDLTPQKGWNYSVQ